MKPEDQKLADLLARCLAADPADCPKDADALYRELRQLGGVQSRRPGAHWLRQIIAGAIVLGLVLGGGYVAWRDGYFVPPAGEAPPPAPVKADADRPAALPSVALAPRNPAIIAGISRTNLVLRLTVSPAGATVRLVNHRANGLLAVPDRTVPDSGEVALELPDDPAADYGLVVFKPGYQINSQSVRADSGPLAIRLDRLRGEVEFRTTPDAMVEVWNRAGAARTNGPVPATGALLVQSLEEGDWGYRIFRPDWIAVTGSLTGLVQGKRLTVERPLSPLPGRLSVAGHATMEIWESERKLGLANAWLPLAAGQHTLRLVRPGFRAETLTLEIPPNRDVARVAPAFVPEAGELRLLADVPAAAAEFFSKIGRKVWLDGKPVVVVSFPHVVANLGVGAHEVRLEAVGFEPVELNATDRRPT